MTIDTAAPTLRTRRAGTGNVATYTITATDATAVTAVSNNGLGSTGCTTAVSTTGAGWVSYTLGDSVAVDDTNGRCVIVTDAAGNKAKQHLADNDMSIIHIGTLTTTMTVS